MRTSRGARESCGEVMTATPLTCGPDTSVSGAASAEALPFDFQLRLVDQTRLWPLRSVGTGSSVNQPMAVDQEENIVKHAIVWIDQQEARVIAVDSDRVDEA